MNDPLDTMHLTSVSEWDQCIYIPAIPNAILTFVFSLIVLTSGYFYARHCGIYSVDDEDNGVGKLSTKLWMIFSQYVVQYMLIILWSYYSFRHQLGVNFVGVYHPWLFTYVLIYVMYSIITTATFAKYCHPTKQLYALWLSVSLVLLLFLSVGILISLFVAEEEHIVENFDTGFSSPIIRFCLCIDMGSLVMSLMVIMLMCHHIVVLLETLFAPYLWGKSYLQYDPHYHRRARNLMSDDEQESLSEIDYNYREKVYNSEDPTIGSHHENDKPENRLCAGDIELQRNVL